MTRLNMAKVFPAWFGVFILGSLLVMLAVPARGEGIAMVTDLSGKARVQGKDALTILSEIETDTRVQLETAATLVTIYLKSGEEYAFSGPAQIRFRANGPQVLSGAPPQKHPNPLSKRGSDITINPAKVTQSGYVMRSSRTTSRIKLLSLSGTRTLDVSPEFRWRAIEADVNYRVELTDDTGHSLFESEVAGTSLRLPAFVTLREGADYTWEVSVRAPDNRRYVSVGDFSLASTELRAQVELLRPPGGSPVSQRVAFATWLEQMELRDEARKYWRDLSAERPADGKLKALAAE